MAGAINGLGGLNATNYAALYNDPYFLQAFNSPNVNTSRATSVPNAGTSLPTATSTATTQGASTTSPSFKGASDAIASSSGKKEKKSNAAAWILGGLAVIGLAYGGYKCYQKGTGEGLSKIWDGAKQYLSGAKNKVSSVTSGAAETFTIAKNGDDVLCTIPGKTNVLKGADVTNDIIARLGGSTEAVSLANKGTEILKYEAKLSDGSVITVMGDKVRKIVDGTGAKVDLSKLNDAGNAEISKIIAGVKNKEQGILDGLQNVIGRQTDNGVTRKFVAQATDSAKDGVRKVATKNFFLDSNAVKAYRAEHPQMSNAIEEFTKGVTSRFSTASADKVTDIGTFKIVGNKIAGIETATGFHSVNSDEYKALLFDNKDIFDGVLSDPTKFTNIVWKAA